LLTLFTIRHQAAVAPRSKTLCCIFGASGLDQDGRDCFTDICALYS
jgi:hypothetical protein